MSILIIAGAGDAKIACEIQVDDYPSAAESARNLKPVLTRQPSQLSRSNSRSGQLRFSGSLQRTATTASIIALPKKIHRSVSRSRCRLRSTGTRIFPKKPHDAGGGGRRKTVVPDAEPSSPKVSCIGKVLSERECGKCKKKFQLKSSEKKRNRRREANGCWGTLAALFHCFGGGEGKNAVAMAESPPPISSLETTGKRSPPSAAAAEPPHLGAMKRFASGRRSASWERVEEEGHVS